MLGDYVVHIFSFPAIVAHQTVIPFVSPYCYLTVLIIIGYEMIYPLSMPILFYVCFKTVLLYVLGA